MVLELLASECQLLTRETDYPAAALCFPTGGNVEPNPRNIAKAFV